MYNSVGVKKKNRLYNLQILLTDIWEKNSVKNEKTKNMCYLKIIKQHVCQVKRKNINRIT